MALWEFKLPDIGEGVTEGEVVSWLVKPGDAVLEDQPMVEIMTDKATVTIAAPKAGKIVETRGAVGAIVKVHGVLVVFDLGGTKTSTNGSAKHEPAATAVGDIRETLPGLSSTVGSSHAAPTGADKPLATPATRKVARDLGVDLRQVVPTGPSGRVTKKDVEDFAGRGAQANGFRVEEALVAKPETASVSSGEERIPFVGMRRKIATRMAQSKHTAAHFTFVESCDVTALVSLRERLRPRAEAAGVKLTYLPMFVKAVVAALKKHPMLNSTLDEKAGELVLRKQYHIGIATSTDAGLMVPVVHDADRRSLLDIAREIDRLAANAKSGRSKPEDMSGSTFTITSLGAQGGLFATPIINYPEVGILGIHRMKERPVVRDGQVVVGREMLLSLSFDHRIVDGHVGAAFAYEILGYLEDPDRLFLEMT